MHISVKKNDSIKIYGLCSIELLISADLKFSTGLSECLLERDTVQSTKSVPLRSVIMVLNNRLLQFRNTALQSDSDNIAIATNGH